jgi:hypothetical protein
VQPGAHSDHKLIVTDSDNNRIRLSASASMA